MDFQDQHLLINQIDFKQHLPNDYIGLNIVLPGDIVTSEPGFMHGNGTFEENGVIYSSIIGTVEKMNKIIMVNPLRSNYAACAGDIIVGRVEEIANKRWKLNIKSNNNAQLHLNSTFLPEQRVKNEQDELNMRLILSENDLACAEVHSIQMDKTVSLHTRNLKYGRLENGLLIEVHNKLIKKQKHHFVELECGIHIILGHNGLIWISNVKRDGQVKQITKKEYTQEDREKMSIVNNIIRILNQEGLEISTELINELYKFIQKEQINNRDLLKQDKQDIILDYLKNKLDEKIPFEVNKLMKQGDFMGFN